MPGYARSAAAAQVRSQQEESRALTHGVRFEGIQISERKPVIALTRIDCAELVQFMRFS